jgi:hypothetical protein
MQAFARFPNGETYFAYARRLFDCRVQEIVLASPLADLEIWLASLPTLVRGEPGSVSYS